MREQRIHSLKKKEQTVLVQYSSSGAIGPGWPDGSPGSHWPDRGKAANVCRDRSLLCSALISAVRDSVWKLWPFSSSTVSAEFSIEILQMILSSCAFVFCECLLFFLGTELVTLPKYNIQEITDLKRPISLAMSEKVFISLCPSSGQSAVRGFKSLLNDSPSCKFRENWKIRLAVK